MHNMKHGRECKFHGNESRKRIIHVNRSNEERNTDFTNTSGEYDYATGVEDRTDGLSGNEPLDCSLPVRNSVNRRFSSRVRA